MIFANVLYIFIIFQQFLLISSIYPCGDPKIKNGRARIKQKGRLVKFVCYTGYILVGDRFASCKNGHWDNPFPKCVRASCRSIKEIPNGLIFPGYQGAVLYFYCKSNYQLHGPNATYCDGTKWDTNAPTCLPSNTKPLLYCDFENDDICGWNHDLNHDFDWTRINQQTPSGTIGTGPSFDHTKGPGKDGYYMYIESSSRHENDTARLISPVYQKTISNTCLEFWYHMYGNSIGTLRVYLKRISEDWSLNSSKIIFNVHGNQGDEWFKSFHQLGIIDEDYQIIIEGVRGSSYTSDIAIDDVKIIENCIVPNITSTTINSDETTPQPPSVFSCKNSCELKFPNNLNDNNIISCDCDYGCIERNRCCPDYFDYCAFLSTSSSSITNEDEEFSTEHTLYETTTTNKKQQPMTDLQNITTTTNKKQQPIIDVQETTSSLTTTTVLASSTTLKKKSSTQPPPPPTITTTSTTPAVLKTTLKNDKKPESNIVYIKPKNDGKQKYNDLATIPPPPLIKDKNKENEIIDVININKKVENIKNKNEKRQQEKHSQLSTILIGGSFGIILISIAIYIAYRYRGKRFLSSSNSGGSQSEIRYLTSDEVLDLDLNY